MSETDDVIDLRPYILLLIANWRKIVLPGILFAGLALAITLVLPRAYEATATLLVSRSRLALSLVKEFPTVNEPVDARSRMEAITSIAESDALALSVMEVLGSELPPESRDLEELRDDVSIASKGDVIEIKALADNPQLATRIANTWAERTVQLINQAYSGEQLPTEIQEQSATAGAEYRTAQAALESFTKDNRIQVLEAQVASTNDMINNLVQEQARQVAYYSERKQWMEQIISQAQALQEQLRSGSASSAARAGDFLAVLKARASTVHLKAVQPPQQQPQKDPLAASVITFETGSQPEMFFNLHLSELGAAEVSISAYQADLERLVEMAKAEQARAGEKLRGLIQTVTQGLENTALDEIAAQMSDLQTQLEREKALQLELTSQRDLAWQAYLALLQKETEVRNAMATSKQVSLASSAVVPEKPVARGGLRNTLLGGIAGLLVGVMWVLGSQWWQSASSLPPEVQPVAANPAGD